MKYAFTLIVVLLSAPLAASHAAETPRKPNFLFIYTDDQR